jgi:hypothetical protein
MFPALAILALPIVLAQEPTAPPPPDTEALRVFLDCDPFTCDLDYLRTEVTFVSYMRDRHDAEVYVLVSTQQTGSGGTEYTLTFIGQGALTGRTDTLRYRSHQTDGPDQVRRGLARTLRIGLMRYVAGTPIGDRIEIRYEAPNAARGRQGHDPWNNWVFTISGSGFFQGQQSTSSRSLSGRLQANRITNEWKINLGVNANASHSFYQLDSATTYTSDNESYGGNVLAVRSLGPHWAAGGQASIGSSTFNNQTLRLRGGPALEYDIFPYGESTRRLLTLNYFIGGEYVTYRDTTIFDKTRETHPVHSLSVSLSATQPWGNTNFSVTASQYLHDLSKQNVNFFGGMSWRVVRGLSVNFFGGYTIVRDQLFLPKSGATQQQILVQQQQLATNYNYFVSIGVSYVFGSIFNNVVNPRFGGGGGTFVISN